MKKIFLWGAGNNLRIVMSFVNNNIKIKGILDNNPILQNTIIDGIKIIRPDKQVIDKNDIVLITAKNYESIVHDASELLEIDTKNIIPFWNIEFDMNPYKEYIDVQRWKAYFFDELQEKYKNESEIHAIRIKNQYYELAEKIIKNPPKMPQIESGLEALNLVAQEKKSMCRYGDGEFEIVHGRERTKLQKPNSELQKRLKEILYNTNDNVLTCIARLYGTLDFFDDGMADVCRRYLTERIREDNMNAIDLNKKYYDAYVSRPYIFARDKSKAKEIFEAWKKIWTRRDIVFVEGIMTRCGYKNDLFSEANSIQRIVCPPTDSWEHYSEILDYIIEHISRDKLILIALGPTATVLAYDLAVRGYQAIDMGHLDNEYEWYIRGCTKMEKVSYKYMNNMGEKGRKADDVDDEEYVNEIIKRIGC